MSPLQHVMYPAPFSISVSFRETLVGEFGRPLYWITCQQLVMQLAPRFRRSAVTHQERRGTWVVE